MSGSAHLMVENFSRLNF